ncbi:MAG: helix-turn-helix transcriptional regulator [Lentisphaeria bacterium]|nr:helix-turn-helix transcriptional regulator [Lentisphaeria bacterium]
MMYGDGFRFGLGSFLKIYYVCCRKVLSWEQNRVTVPFWRFSYDFEPGAVMTIKGRKIVYRSDKFYIAPAFTEFSSTAVNPFRRFYIHFSPGEHTGPVDDIYILPARERELAIIREFAALGEQATNSRATMFYAMAVLAPSLLRLPETVVEKGQPTDPRIDAVVKYIAEHTSAPKDNTFLARMAGMSCNGFLRLFEAQTGRSPQAYWRRKRIEQACGLLLSTQLSIDEIAERTGFADRYHFTRVFSSVLKCSPAGFRKKN